MQTKRRISKLISEIVGPFCLAAVMVGHAFASDSQVGEKFSAAARGFGNVDATLRLLGDKKASSLTTFSAEDAAHAKICASKRLADLLGFGDIKLVADSGMPGTVLELKDTGWWLLGIDGAAFRELYAPNKKALERLVKECKAESWQAVPTRAYPRWLDCFDNAGAGIWFGGGGASVDIPSEFPWMQKRGMTMNFHPPTEGRYVAPGVLDTTMTDWFSAMAARYDIPFRVHCWERKPAWLWNRETLPYVRRAPGYLTSNLGWAASSLYAIPYGSEPVSASDPYTLDFRRRFTASLNADPNFLATKGVAEIPEAGVVTLTAVAGMPETKAYWHSYLVHVLGLDLPKVGLLHHGRRDFYQSWDQVEVPTPRDFLGLDAESLNLSGTTWEGMADRELKGVKGKWYAADSMPKEGWVPANPNDPMLLLYRGGQFYQEKRADYWLRRTVTVTAGQLAKLKYLHIERPALREKYCDAYLNGQSLKQITTDQANDLTVSCEVNGALHEGDNQLVLRMEGRPAAGSIVLGTLPPRPYPHMSEPENRRWYDATNFSAWLKMRGVEQVLQAMRAAEPNRPLKMMATINMLDMSTDLGERYGAYQHDTGGAAAYWCPMTGGRLARSHGLPFSCEQGGPPPNATELQNNITFYVMYGNDAADLVFATSHYKDNPEIAAWFDKNLELIHCIGKMHLPVPSIAVLRSTRATRLGFVEPWNWDIGRGALQGVGRNFAYVEVPDILNGTIDQFPVVIDDGTVLLTDEDIEGIQRYVRRGGIFVAQHHTGRHSPEKADSWALAKAWGLSITPKYMTEEVYHQWPLAKMRFSKDQDLLPSLRGQEIEGSGVAVDFLGREFTGAVSIKGAGDTIRPVATWNDGTMAIADVHEGRGRFILLGTPFYTRMRDVNGTWVNDDKREALLDEFLASLGVPRDSWSPLWAELWRSKNGVYDLYPVARMSKTGGEKVAAEVNLRRAAPTHDVVEVSALGHPKVKATWKDGKLTLPVTDYGLMQSRVYIAPRAEIARSALDWFQGQSQIWRALPPMSVQARPEPISVPEDVIPAVEEWRMSVGGTDAAWVQPGFAADAWKPVKLGTFTAIGIPENSTARFRKEIVLPASWKGQAVFLDFSGEWSCGVAPMGRLWINGQPASVRQPLNISGDTSFCLDVTEQAKAGKLTLAVEVDASKLDKSKPQAQPAGVTGIFLLRSEAPPVTTTPLAGPWFAARDVNVLTPVAQGQKANKYTYLETKFTLPKDWPARRVFLGSPVKLHWLILNNQVIQVPAQSLDISGLVRRDGENILRWIPDCNQVPDINVEHNGNVPELNLMWMK